VGCRTPKQFLRLGGSPILTLTVGHFVRHPAIGSVIVVGPPDQTRRTERLLAPLARRRPITVVPGGRERQDSVRHGLNALSEDAEIVIVHDAVRPFLTAALITAVIDEARRYGAAMCALPLTETIKRVEDGCVRATVDRSTLWSAQTPQAFRALLLREAHDKALRDGFLGTDEAMLVERLGHVVRVVRGLPENVKITTSADLRRGRDRA
jgi:2-C-methyl-D-erythritol 4-phosphate cytidylyltransferase